MVSAYIQGMGTGAGLIVAIGAQNSFVLSQGVRKNFHWVVALICALCDIVLIFAGAAGLGTVIAENTQLAWYTGWLGVLFLFGYGLRALRSAMVGGALERNQGTQQSLQAVVVTTLAITLCNPHVYLDTVVLLGSISGQFPGQDRYVFALGAATSSLLWFYLLSLGGALLAPLFTKAFAWKILDIVVCLTMWTIAVQLIPVGNAPL